MSLKGNLASVNLTEIFQMLSLSGREGTLFIYEGARKRAICFTKEGVSIRSRDRNEGNLVGRILVRLGKIDERDLQRAVEMRRVGEKLFGDTLVDLGVCSPEDVDLALRIQSEEEIQDLFLNRSDAQFEYVDGYFPETEVPYVHLNVNSLLIEIARRTDEWEYIRRRIRGPREIYRFTGQEGAVDADVLAECYAHRVDPMIDGSHSVGEIIELSYVNKFEVCKLLAAYLDATVIEQVPPETLRQNARLALRMGDTESAIRHYEYLMATGDYPLDVMAEAAEAHEANRDFGEAAALLRRLGEELARGGDIRGAIDALRPVANYPRPEPEALRFLMELVFDNPRAAAEFQSAVVEAAKTLTAHYAAHGQKSDAIEMLEHLIETYPDEVAFVVSLVNVHYEDGAIEVAADECERMAGRFMKRKRTAHAISLYKKLLVIDPSRTDIRERVRQLMQGKRRRIPALVSRLAVVLGVTLLLGGVAVVVVNKRSPGGSGSGGLDPSTRDQLLGRAVSEQASAAEHGRNALEAYRGLLEIVAGDVVSQNDAVMVGLRNAERSWELFLEAAEKCAQIAETIRRQTADSEVTARARAMLEKISARRNDVEQMRSEWHLRAQDTAVRLQATGSKHYQAGKLQAALENFVLVRELATKEGWKRAIKVGQRIANIRRDLGRANELIRAAKAREEVGDWIGARAQYVRVLQEFGRTDIVNSIRMPVELLSIPPGATIVLDGVKQSLKTPAILRLPVNRASRVRFNKPSFKSKSFQLGPYGAETDPAKWTTTFALRKTATWSRALRGDMEPDPAATASRLLVAERLGRWYLMDARNGQRVDSGRLKVFDGISGGLAGNNKWFFVPTLDGTVYMHRAATGSVAYKLRLKNSEGVAAKPLLRDGILYVVGKRGLTVAWDLRGKKPKTLWRKRAEGGTVRAVPVLQDGHVVVVTTTGEVTVFRAKSGQIVIRYKVPGTFRCAPAAAGREDLIFASEEGRLFAVRRVTGNVQWQKDVATPLLRTPPVHGRAVFVSPQPAQLIAIDVNTGVQIYRYRQSSAAGRQQVEPKDRIFFSHGPTLTAFAPSQDGYALAWTFRAQGRIVAGPVVREDAVYIVDDKGYVYRLEANDS